MTAIDQELLNTEDDSVNPSGRPTRNVRARRSPHRGGLLNAKAQLCAREVEPADTA